MKLRVKFWVICLAGGLASALVAMPGAAQGNAAANISDAERTLIVKAQALESRGRPDIAAQVWSQILLSDPRNQLAMEGVARCYRLSGNGKASDEALDRLRRAYPTDPNIGKIQSMMSNRTRDERLGEAGALAKAGNPDAAMKLYREYFGQTPPDGDMGMAYYDTLYATANGKSEAIAGMRAMASRNPSEPRYAVALGRMLSYDARTRGEGIKILRDHQKDPEAAAALRQALLWDAANPNSAPELKVYVTEHPGDTEISSKLKENEAKLAQMNSGIARTPEEKAAFAALNAHRLDEAQARFQALLDADPGNGRAAAGMGFLRMQQNNFGGAVSFLTQAEANGYKAEPVVNALATSRFWYTMGEATAAFDANQLDEAAEHFHEALKMNPRSPEALNGLAGLYLKNEQYQAAVDIYQQLLKVKPGNEDALRGEYLAYMNLHQNAQALALLNRMPAGLREKMNKDPGVLQGLAQMYLAAGRTADAQKVLAQALALPFPENGATLKNGTRMQYAGILMQARRFDQAANLFTQVLDEDTSNLAAWMGLVSAQHELGHDEAAIAEVERMPPDVYEAALSDVGFLTMLGSMYQQANQYEIAQGLLERTLRIQQKSGGKPSVSLLVQLATIYLQRSNTEQAYGLYREILTAQPDNLDAWRGLIGTLQTTNRNAQALQEIQMIPPAVRAKLEADVKFQQSEASIYAASGDNVNALATFARVVKYYKQQNLELPPDAVIQYAYLLYNSNNDRALYPLLMQLGARKDLTPEQVSTVQGIWANWAVRRSATAFDNGNNARALEILDAAAKAFPENMNVRRAVAGGYLRAGHARESLAIFKTIPMQDGSAADFQGAIGAALAAGDKVQAEVWLRQALDRYGHDAQILTLAARFEQARGANGRAADYWRASLGAMPEVNAADRLAHELVHPDPAKTAEKANTPRDLTNLLNPEDEPFVKTGKLPPLPSYGHDPYDGSAPVVLPNPGGSGGASVARPAQVPVYQVPTTTNNQLPADALATTPTVGTADQSAKARTARKPANSSGYGPGTTGAKPAAGTTTHSRKAGQSFEGRMNLPPYGEPVTTTDAVPGAQPTRTQGVGPQSSLTAPEGGQGLKLSSEPMNLTAARAQALLSEQTDGQLSQGFSLHALGNAKPSTQVVGAAPVAQAERTQLSQTQYTPSPQDAVAGAYSAQTRTPAQIQQPVQTVQEPVQQVQTTPPPVKQRRRVRAAKVPPQGPSTPTLVTAPGGPLPEQQVTDGLPGAQPGQAASSSGLSDQELEERNLPPLRGPWVRIKRETPKPGPREEAEQQLRLLEAGYSGWLGGTGNISHRTGDLGFEALTALEAPMEASFPLGSSARFTILARPVFLDSGQADGTAQIRTISVGGTVSIISEPIGTLAGADAAANPPAQQNAAGVGGEVQLTWANFGIAAGYTPAGFLVSTITGRAIWKPGNGPFSFSFLRDSVKDTQLSYSGLRDPGSATATFPGNIWGGVVTNQGNVQWAKGDLASGYYVGGGGQYLTGYKVKSNTRFDGSLGAYWRVKAIPEEGNLNVGINFFAMHYATNLQAFTFGMGGYFSPQAYFLANVPVTWTGNHQNKWHYTVMGSAGMQAFETQRSSLAPLSPQEPGVLYLAPLTSVGPNYDLRGQVAYALSDHWFVGGFATANNSRNYNNITAGFSVRYLFRSQPGTATGPTGLFLTDDQHAMRPLMVP